ncbi:MAG: hypothetical protein GTO63_15885 [Anaerolineae bacterium]|nr:hypothetical protein [Anaerolineae bacterium]NIN96307.1 hypothetical protein [Anaerolineae bacterium]NIQ79327.1 hypothetical protein [Anaerolineae bacterium]
MVVIALSLSAKNHTCPYCKAPPGADCTTKSGRPIKGEIPVHAKRLATTTESEKESSRLTCVRFKDLPLFRGLNKGRWP